MKLEDLIDIPERVHQGDFVLKLSEGVTRADETLDHYVLTPPLVQAFDEALAFVGASLSERASKACYLHASFGAGKSHFMAVLHLLLSGHAKARAMPEVAPLLRKYGAVLDGKRYLLVPYHLIGAASMESAILGGYVDFVRRVHPDSPLPGIWVGDKMIDDAREFRTKLGDDLFFKLLNDGQATAQATSGWKNMARGWDAVSFERAARAPESSTGGDERTAERRRLVGDLVRTFFKGYADLAKSGDARYVALDDGLEALSRHAKDLGYDALILFLDELVLWLSSHAGELEFLNREGQKLVKLCEATNAARPIPIVSFVARQRDLRELIGEHVAGAEKMRFTDTLRHWEERFHKILLETRSLGAIAKKRLLAPKDEKARRTLDDLFTKTRDIRREVRDVLLGDEDDQSFRDLYPFSPVLVDTLVRVSSALQRERTALRIMLQMLVHERGHLDAGEIIPVGDLFDALSEGTEPFSADLRKHFEAARTFYERRFLPLMEKTYKMSTERLLALPADDPARRNFRSDARLMKTLLLSALFPDVKALGHLTGARLAALNWGGIRSPVPGREGAIISQKLRQWAAEFGELRSSGDDRDPTFALQISGVDVESILMKVEGFDNDAARRARVRDLLFEALGVEKGDGREPWIRHEQEWRGSERMVEIVYGNVREMSDTLLRPATDEACWRLVIDYPFDAPNHSPKDDLERVNLYRRDGKEARTLCWLPNFLKPELMSDLGKLVRIDTVLAGQQLEQNYAAHLSLNDRSEARMQLESQKKQLEARMRLALEAAYGVRTGAEAEGYVGLQLEPHESLRSLDAIPAPGPQPAPNLAEALRGLLDATFEATWPDHPRFPRTPKIGEWKKIAEFLLPVFESAQRRVETTKDIGKLLSEFAEPLGLGRSSEGVFLPDDGPVDKLARAASRITGRPSVKALRASLDEQGRRGLSRPAENLLILVFAAAKRMSFDYRGGPAAVGVDRLDDEVELRKEDVPDEATWTKMVARFTEVLGGAPPPNRPSASAQRDVLRRFEEELKARRADVDRCHAAWRPFAARFGLDESCDRSQTAAAALELFETLAVTPEKERIAAFVKVRVPTNASALGAAIARAREVAGEIERFHAPAFDALLESVRSVAPDDAERVSRELVRALANDDLVSSLGRALKSAQDELAAIARKHRPSRDRDGGASRPAAGGATTTPAPLPAVTPVESGAGKPATGGAAAPSAPRSGEIVVSSMGEVEKELKEVLKQLASRRGARLRIIWRIEEER